MTVSSAVQPVCGLSLIVFSSSRRHCLLQLQLLLLLLFLFAAPCWPPSFCSPRGSRVELDNVPAHLSPRRAEVFVSVVPSQTGRCSHCAPGGPAVLVPARRRTITRRVFVV